MAWRAVRWSAALIGVLLGGGAGAQRLPIPEPRISPTVVTVAPPRQARVPMPGGAVQLPGVAYAQPPGFQPITLDLYLPPAGRAKPAGGYPLVIYIHGGGWMGGDPRKSGAFADFPAVLASMAARGYVAASLSYRLSGEARFPAQAADVRAAIRWLKGHAGEYGLNPDKVVVWGASAGGHLAGLAATGCHVAALDWPPPPPATPGVSGPPPNPYASISPCVQGAVTWYGVFDLTTLGEQARSVPGAGSHDGPDAAEWRLLGCTPATCRGGEVALASPVTHVGRDTPPMLLIAGTADKTVPPAQSQEMAAALTRAGVRNRLILLPGIDHSFIGARPEVTRKASLDALAATLAFIDQTIGAKR